MDLNIFLFALYVDHDEQSSITSTKDIYAGAVIPIISIELFRIVQGVDIGILLI